MTLDLARSAALPMWQLPQGELTKNVTSDCYASWKTMSMMA
jgi:hypothetical protein